MKTLHFYSPTFQLLFPPNNLWLCVLIPNEAINHLFHFLSEKHLHSVFCCLYGSASLSCQLREWKDHIKLITVSCRVSSQWAQACLSTLSSDGVIGRELVPKGLGYAVLCAELLENCFSSLCWALLLLTYVFPTFSYSPLSSFSCSLSPYRYVLLLYLLAF